MRKIFLALMVLFVVAVVGAHFWVQAAYNRIAEASDLGLVEVQRIWAGDFERASILAAPEQPGAAPVVEADTGSEEGEEGAEAEEAEEEAKDAEAAALEDATTYYRILEDEAAGADPEDWDLVKRIQAGAEGLEPAAVNELFDRHERIFSTVEMGLSQTKCSPWDTPLRGQGMGAPNARAHRFVHDLLVARALHSDREGRHEDAASDLLHTLAYTQDLQRTSTCATRLHFAPLQAEAATELQKILAKRPLSPAALERILGSLVTLDEIETPPSQTLHLEQIVHLLELGGMADQQVRPGTAEQFAGVFDLRSTHQLADAAERVRASFDQMEKAIDQPVFEVLIPVDSFRQELQASPNPVLSALAPDLGTFKLVVAEALRMLRLAQLTAALQLHHSSHRLWPQSLPELKARYLRNLPVDPYTGALFQYRVASDSEVRLRSPGYEGRLPTLDLGVEVPAAAAPGPATVTPETVGAP